MLTKILFVSLLLWAIQSQQIANSTNYTNEFIVNFYRGFNPSHVLTQNCSTFPFDQVFVNFFKRTAGRAKNSSSDEEGEQIVKDAFAELNEILSDMSRTCDLDIPALSIVDTLKSKEKLTTLPFKILMNSDKIKADLKSLSQSKRGQDSAFFIGSLVGDLFDPISRPQVSISLVSVPEVLTNTAFAPVDILTNFTYGITRGLSRSERRGSKCSKGFESFEDLLKNFTKYFAEAENKTEGLTAFKGKLDDVWGFFGNARIVCEMDLIIQTIQEYQTDEGKAKYSAKAVLFKNKIQEVSQDFSKALFSGDFEKCGYDLGSIVQMMTGISLK